MSHQGCPGGVFTISKFPSILLFKIKHFEIVNFLVVTVFYSARMHAKTIPSCPTLCNPMVGSLPGSSAHGIYLLIIKIQAKG